MEIQEFSLTLADFIQGHQERIWAASWHPSGEFLATCSSDKSICVWSIQNPPSLKLLHSSKGAHERTIRSICFSQDGDYLASGSFDGFVSIWKFDPESKGTELEKFTVLDGHESEVKSVDWSFCNKYLASCSRDKRIIIWDISEEVPKEFSCNDILEGHTQDVKCIKWEKSGEERLYSASYDNSIKVWGFEDDGWECQDSVSHNGTVWSIALSNDSKYLVSGSEDLEVRLWKIGNGKIKFLLKFPNVHTFPIYSVDIKDRLICSSSGDNSIAVYSFNVENDHTDAKLLFNKECHDNDVNSINFHPYKNYIVTISDDELIKLWKF